MATGASALDVMAAGSLAGQLQVSDATTPYLWSGTGWYTASGNALGYATQSASAIGFKALSEPPTPTQLSPQPGPLTWSYSRPLATGTLASAKFIPTTSGVNQTGSGVPVPGAVTIEGALLTVTPTTQLVPGVSYYLQWENGSVGPIVDTDGDTVARPTLSATVSLTIVASAKISGAALLFGTSATLALDASASTHPAAPSPPRTGRKCPARC